MQKEIAFEGWRKYSIALVCVLLGFLLEAFKADGVSAEFVTLCAWVIGLYGGANAAVHVAKNIGAKNETPAG